MTAIAGRFARASPIPSNAKTEGISGSRYPGSLFTAAEKENEPEHHHRHQGSNPGIAPDPG